MDATPPRRIAVVTGSEDGIGRATAVALAAGGCDVGVVWHDDADRGRETVRLVESAGGRAALERLDLGPGHRPDAVLDALADRLGGLDVLVNVAGTHLVKPALETSEDELRHVLEVNLVGAFVLARAAARRMIAAGRGGRIVNVTSILAERPAPGFAAYTASKAALTGLTESLALELAPQGITVNAVAPGAIAVPRTGFEPGAPPDALRRGDVPVGRLGLPDEIARAIVHLAAPESGYTTGTTLLVDGGLALRRPLPAPPQPARGRVAGRLRRALRG